MKAGGEVAALRDALGSARLVLRIFFSLNSPGLTEVRPARKGVSPPWWIECCSRACPASQWCGRTGTGETAS